MSSYPDDILNLEPLLDRLEQMEARLKAMEAKSMEGRPVAGEIGMRVRLQARDIETLQQQLDDTRERVSDESALVKQRFREISHELPALLESFIVPHLSTIRDRMQAEMQKSVEEKLAAFEQALEKKMAHRLASLEKALIDQAGIITTLSERAIQSDSNLQRLIAAVEKLCERGEIRAVPQPESAELPFEGQLHDAIKRQPDSGFRPRLVRADERQSDDERRRPRTPLTRL